MHRIIHSSSPLDLERHSHNIIYSSQTVYLLILSGDDGLCPTFALGFFALKIYFLIKPPINSNAPFTRCPYKSILPLGWLPAKPYRFIPPFSAMGSRFNQRCSLGE